MMINSIGIFNSGLNPSRVNRSADFSRVSKVSFKNSRDVADVLINEVKNEYEDSGRNNLDIIAYGGNDPRVHEASKTLVREGHFFHIAHYLSKFEGAEVSQQDKSVICGLSFNLSELGQTNPKVSKFVQGILESPKISHTVKEIIQSTFR